MLYLPMQREKLVTLSLEGFNRLLAKRCGTKVAGLQKTNTYVTFC